MTEQLPTHKPIIIRIGLLLGFIAFGLRIFQTTIGPAPVAAAASPNGATRVSLAEVVSPSVTADPSAIAYVRVETLTPCGTAALGLYAPADAPCQPTRTITLNWLQSQLASAGVLAQTEYLDSTENVPACFAAIYADTQLTGYLCADATGLYRADTNAVSINHFELWTAGQ